MSNPGCTSKIFSIIRHMAGRDGLKLARSFEKDTYKLEAHHHHLRFTHRTLDNCWLPKSLRFNPPGKHKVFRQIMERASKHCMRARISICHERINFVKKRIHRTTRELASILPQETFDSLSNFLKQRALNVRDSINIRHEKKFDNMKKEHNEDTNIDRSNWVINLSKKPLLPTPNAYCLRKARSLLSRLLAFLIRILYLKSKPQYTSCLTKRKTSFAQTLPVS